MDTALSMLPGMPILGACFDTTKVTRLHPHGSPGKECWAVIWRTVSPRQLKGVRLFEGEPIEIQNRRPGAYFAAAFQSDNEKLLLALRGVLDKAVAFQQIAAEERFLLGDDCLAEPLIGIGGIDPQGAIVGGGGWALIAYEEVKASLAKPLPAGALRIACCNCSKVLAVTRDLLGKTIKCPVCEYSQTVTESYQRRPVAAAAARETPQTADSDSSIHAPALRPSKHTDDGDSSIHTAGSTTASGGSSMAGGSTLRLGSSSVIKSAAVHPALQEPSPETAKPSQSTRKSLWSRLFPGKILGPFDERYCSEQCMAQAMSKAEVKRRLHHQASLRCGACNEAVSAQRIHFVLANGVIRGSGVEEWIFICHDEKCKKQWKAQFRKHWDRCVACGRGLD